MSLRFVFLDFGNTLVHEVPSRFEIYAEAARSLGARVDEATMRGLMVRAHRDLPESIDGAYRYTDPWFQRYIRRIFGDELGLTPSDWDAFQARLFERFSDPRTFRLFPGTRELIEALRSAGLGVGIISNWSPRLPRLIQCLELHGLFEPVVCSAIEGLEKPSPEIFQLALERSGARAEDCLHAGDHIDKDCRAAQKMGMATVLVDHGDELEAGSFDRVTSLEQLQDHILGPST